MTVPGGAVAYARATLAYVAPDHFERAVGMVLQPILIHARCGRRPPGLLARDLADGPRALLRPGASVRSG